MRLPSAADATVYVHAIVNGKIAAPAYSRVYFRTHTQCRRLASCAALGRRKEGEREREKNAPRTICNGADARLVPAAWPLKRVFTLGSAAAHASVAHHLALEGGLQSSKALLEGPEARQPNRDDNLDGIAQESKHPPCAYSQSSMHPLALSVERIVFLSDSSVTFLFQLSRADWPWRIFYSV